MTKETTVDRWEGSETEKHSREELETAWLRGWTAHQVYGAVINDPRRMAADYAERVVGGLTRPERPK